MKLTVDQLIKNKTNIVNKRNVTKNIYVDSLEGEITIKSAPQEVIIDIMGMSERTDIIKSIVYECVISPNLKDKELHKAFDCLEPSDIVFKLFTVAEAGMISDIIANISGAQNKVKIIDEVKN